MAGQAEEAGVWCFCWLNRISTFEIDTKRGNETGDMGIPSCNQRERQPPPLGPPRGWVPSSGPGTGLTGYKQRREREGEKVFVCGGFESLSATLCACFSIVLSMSRAVPMREGRASCRARE